MILKLVLRNIRHDAARIFPAALGVAAAVGLLSWHLGLAFTALSHGETLAKKATAPFSAWVSGPVRPASPPAQKARPNADAVTSATTSPTGRERATAEATMGRRFSRGGRAPIPQSLIDNLKSSDIVEKTVELTPISVTLDVRPGGRVLQGPPFSAKISLLPRTGIPFAVGVTEGRLPDPKSPTPEVVASSALFGTRVPKMPLGSEVPIILKRGTVNAKIVGYFDMGTMIMEFPNIYCNDALMEAIKKDPLMPPSSPTLSLIETKPSVNPADVGFIIDKTPGAGRCQLYTTDAVAGRFRTDTVNNLMSQMPMSLTLALITSAFLLGTILMIGLALQRRRIAELRCAGMTRGGVARLIIVETLVILIAGWLLGFVGGTLFLQIFLLAQSDGGELPSFVRIVWQTPVYSALLAFIVGFISSMAPVFSSMRVRPLDVKGRDITATRPVSVAKTITAILLLLPMPLIAMDLEMPETLKTRLMLFVGIPCLVASVVLGMHAFMRFTELIFLHPTGIFLRLDPRILQRRLSRDPARAAGTILTLAFGLGGFITVHIWGGTLMSSFVPNPEWPDAIVSILPSGLSAQQTEALAKCKGIADNRAIPIECTQMPFDRDCAKKIAACGGGTDGAILLFGADPAQAFGLDCNPLAPMKFVEGDRVEAARLLASGNYCVIPAMLSRITKLHRGDKFSIAGKEIEIAGVVDLNWHMVTSRANVRTRFGVKESLAKTLDKIPERMRTLGVAFVSEKLVRELTGNTDRTYFVWLNMSEELRRIDALQASIKLDEEIRAAVEADGSSAIRVHHRDEIEDGTLSHGNNLLGAMARIPFWSLLVTSTGIVALLIASVKGSRREFEVMRAIGMTRGELARLILGEAIMVTLCAIFLSLVCGILIGWSFTGLSRWLLSAGLPVRLFVPWGQIAKGLAFAFGLCLVMSVLPLARLTRLDRET